MDYVDVEVFVMVDQDGDAVASTDKDNLADLWADNIGDVPPGSRVVRIALKIPRPKVTTVAATLPELPEPSAAVEVE